MEYYQVLLQYKVSVIEMDDERLELDEVIEIFERLNLGGKKLNLFSIIAARSYKAPEEDEKGFDLASKISIRYCSTIIMVQLVILSFFKLLLPA